MAEILPWDTEPRTHKGIGPHEHDPRTLDVAARVAALVHAVRSDLSVEHIGSTSVPGLAGKNIVDLMIVAQPEDIPAIVEGLLSIGFNPQSGRDPFPPTRPMLEGTMRHDGAVFGVHCHVVPLDDPGPARDRAFRDRLREDAVLREAYVAEKRRIVEDGVTDSLDYSYIKGEFVGATLREMELRD
jgi:GrpB-like predicted nucleotidyltransferase (UPF0157 family)